MKYFGYYADSAKADKANCTLAAVNKMDYIADVIANLTGSAEIISFSAVADTIKTDEYIELREGFGLNISILNRTKTVSSGFYQDLLIN